MYVGFLSPNIFSRSVLWRAVQAEARALLGGAETSLSGDRENASEATMDMENF